MLAAALPFVVSQTLLAECRDQLLVTGVEPASEFLDDLWG